MKRYTFSEKNPVIRLKSERHKTEFQPINKKSLREHIPIEQGLRPFDIADSISDSITQRAYSNRTRIKTGK